VGAYDRRRRAGSAALAAVLALGVLAACGGDDGAEPSTTASSEPATTTTAVPPGGLDYEVGRSSFTVVDPTRTTAAVAAAGLAEQPSRSIDVTVLYPSVDGGPAPGPFPVVVFAHGWNGTIDRFLAPAEVWAEAGYVAALPTFPLSREGVAIGDDYVNQPGDISAVLDSLAEGGPDGSLDGLVDLEHVAVGGHSLGSATVFRAAYNSCCVDDRIDATIPVSGGPADIGQGGYETWPETPMLLVHGVVDQAVPIAVGDGVFDLVGAPVRYLRMDDADHVSVFEGANGVLFADAVLDFLDATIGGDETGFDRLDELVADSGIAELRVRD
jgi:pimeloyl-ACP methyl ester carboxylesterase